MGNWGFKPSVMDGTEHRFSAPTIAESIPAHYSYKRFLPAVINQGANPICVPCAISAYLNWRENLKNKSKRDNKIDYFEIYDSKTVQGEGMTFKEAFRYLRHHGVSSNLGNLEIEEYSFVGSALLLKMALVINGPCFGALPVYNSTAFFWEKRTGDTLEGYHAVAIVGYDKNGFIIRNSWGTGFGQRGYTTLPYDDFSNFMELWTISE